MEKDFIKFYTAGHLSNRVRKTQWIGAMINVAYSDGIDSNIDIWENLEIIRGTHYKKNMLEKELLC